MELHILSASNQTAVVHIVSLSHMHARLFDVDRQSLAQ